MGIAGVTFPFDGGRFRVFHSSMKKMPILTFLVVFTAATVFGQDSATQQQLDKLGGQIQDLQAAIAQQDKRISALEKEVGDLSNKVGNLSDKASNSASVDDLKKLAEQVQEIDQKRQADNEKILKALEKLGSKVAAGRASQIKPVTSESSNAAGSQKGYYYPVQSGDTISAIAKAYRDQGVKVTTEQILKANPGLDPKSLIPGKKIFIPDPKAK